MYHIFVLSQLLDEIFNTFANLWMDSKVQAKEMQELASQRFKFRTRRVKIERVVEVDIRTLGKSFENEIFNDWKKFAAEEGHIEEVDALITFLNFFGGIGKCWLLSRIS